MTTKDSRMKATYRKTLIDLLTLPTAPLCEEYVVGYIRRWADRRPGIEFKQDEYGNVRLRVKRGSGRVAAPIMFSAHMDHPGFEAERMVGPRRLRAVWQGWVAPSISAERACDSSAMAGGCAGR
jgi:hypothetical protein